MVWASRHWAGNMEKGECCTGLGERVCLFISGKSSMTVDPLEASSYTGGEGIGKIANIPEGLWLEKRWDRGEEGKDRLKVA